MSKLNHQLDVTNWGNELKNVASLLSDFFKRRRKEKKALKKTAANPDKEQK